VRLYHQQLPHEYKLPLEVVAKKNISYFSILLISLIFKYMALYLESFGDYSCVKLSLILEPTDVCSENNIQSSGALVFQVESFSLSVAIITVVLLAEGPTRNN
jgi:hypothetical protein